MLPNVASSQISKKPLPGLIKRIRNTNNLTQASFGKLFQPPVSQPTVARWEKGEQNPERRHFLKIASFLDLTFEELLEILESPHNIASSLKIEKKVLTPNKEHLSVLKRGSKVWNRWRIKNPDVIPDLVGADSWPIELSRIDLSGVNLRGSDLSGIDFTQANLASADLREATLNRVNFTQADLRLAKMSQAKIKNTDFTRAYLSGVNLSGAILDGSSFYKANLEKADLSNAYFFSVDLRDAKLNSANLEYANLQDSFVYGVSVWDIKLKGAVQKKLSICPWKTSYIYINDIRAAYIKSLAIANFEDPKITNIVNDFQENLEASS